MTQNELIQKIEAFASLHGFTPSAVTKRAVGNSRTYDTLVGGGSCTLKIAEKIVSYMDGFDALNAIQEAI